MPRGVGGGAAATAAPAPPPCGAGGQAGAGGHLCSGPFADAGLPSPPVCPLAPLRGRGCRGPASGPPPGLSPACLAAKKGCCCCGFKARLRRGGEEVGRAGALCILWCVCGCAALISCQGNLEGQAKLQPSCGERSAAECGTGATRCAGCQPLALQPACGGVAVAAVTPHALWPGPEGAQRGAASPAGPWSGGGGLVASSGGRGSSWSLSPSRHWAPLLRRSLCPHPTAGKESSGCLRGGGRGEGAAAGRVGVEPQPGPGNPAPVRVQSWQAGQDVCPPGKGVPVGHQVGPAHSLPAPLLVLAADFSPHSPWTHQALSSTPPTSPSGLPGQEVTTALSPLPFTGQASGAEGGHGGHF